MAGKPEQEPGSPGGSSDPVQRAEVPGSWLDEAGHDDLADNVDRLQGDVDLVTSLALQKYEGDLWDFFSNELAKYGFAVIKSWIATKVIYERCRQKGWGLKRLDRDFTQDEIDGLAGETVAKALFHFKRDVLMQRRWDPTKGASLRTFFVGQCLLRFLNIHRDFLDEVEADRRNGYTDDDDELDYYSEKATPVDRQVIASIVASKAMSEIEDPRVRKAMHMTADGYPQTDIARVLGVSVKAVERMLANERERLRKRGVG